MELIGMNAICESVKMSPSTVLSWIREAGFPARKVRGRGIWISDTDAIAAWLKKYVEGGADENASAPPRKAGKHQEGKRKSHIITQAHRWSGHQGQNTRSANAHPSSISGRWPIFRSARGAESKRPK